jgi:hypothetical protein
VVEISTLKSACARSTSCWRDRRHPRCDCHLRLRFEAYIYDRIFLVLIIAAVAALIIRSLQNGEIFGFDRTRQMSTQYAQQIAEAAQRFGQQDDITVFTVSYNGTRETVAQHQGR